jgi:hypothetical protein
MKDEQRSKPSQNGQKNEAAQAITKSDNSRGNLLKRIGIYAAILIAAFLLGLIPMWLRARDRANQLEEVRLELRRSQMQNMLTSAVIDARRGEYEMARQSVSSFYTSTREEIDRNDSAFSETQRATIDSLLKNRDELITLLARSDPAAADRLSDLYVNYRKAMGNGSANFS